MAGAVMAGLSLSACAADRVITADYQLEKGTMPGVFRECVGAGRAAEGLRADWQAQLKRAHEEIGFRSIRFHGVLSDDMGVYSETRAGEPVYNFQYVDKLYDAILALGMKPYVELSFMPAALASGKKTMFWWKANVTLPKSMERWDELITRLATHLTERYGEKEVKQWCFEVWNEPDYAGFFEPSEETRRQTDYFDLYAHTARAIKAVNPGYRVGGPATSNTNWVRPFLEFAGGKVPVDFISFHAYGLGGGIGGIDEFGDQLHYLSDDLHQPAAWAVSQRAVIDATPLAKLPIHLTEWSTSYSSRDPVHDAYFSAPYILEQYKAAGDVPAIMSYWVFSDIFEEGGPPPTPFHGGFGLLNLQGIRKPAYFAFQFLNRLGPTELRNADAASWVTRDEAGNIQILVWDLTNPAGGSANQAVFRKINEPKSKGNVTITISHMPAGDYRCTRWQVGYEKNDAYSVYLKMGAPRQLTREQEGALQKAAAGEPEAQTEIRIDGTFTQTVALRENDVILLTLTRR